jgi:Dyp-type peroxidase family
MVIGRIMDAAKFGEELRAMPEAWASGGAEHGTLTIAFTASGLRKLGVRYQWHAPFVEDAFAQGMVRRAPQLGDTGESGLGRWDKPWRPPKDLHVALWMQAASAQALGQLDKGVRQHFTSVEVAIAEPTAKLTATGPSTEHFGFVDGVSQPWLGIRTKDDQARSGGKLDSRGRWQPLALGEFVLGQVDETGDIFPVPGPAEVFLGGTFLVVRKLEQDVTKFRKYIATDLAGVQNAAAKLVGRNPDGSPLAQASQGDRNDFTYGRDPEGAQCPLGAHIRRSNPRDALGFGTTLSARRRILRRAMPYGPPYHEGDKTPRGLLFLALNVRIAEQFEFIQEQWLNDGSTIGRGALPDPISGLPPGNRPRELIIEGRPPTVRRGLPVFVQTRGGAYLFVPSRPGLAAIATYAIAASNVRRSPALR